MHVEVIAIQPNPTQKGDVGLEVGMRFEVRQKWTDGDTNLEEGEVRVDSPDGKGAIILNRGEWREVSKVEAPTFELYCVEIAKIPYYNFLTEEEREHVREGYDSYLRENGWIEDQDDEE